MYVCTKYIQRRITMNQMLCLPPVSPNVSTEGLYLTQRAIKRLQRHLCVPREHPLGLLGVLMDAPPRHNADTDTQHILLTRHQIRPNHMDDLSAQAQLFYPWEITVIEHNYH